MSKIRKAEEFVYATVMAGELEIDSEGRIWRVACRRGDRWGGPARSVPVKRQIADRVGTAGYRNVRAMIDGKRMTALSHRLVWLHLRGPIPDGMTVNHKNGDKADNRPDNLELATDSEQMLHATRVLKVGKAANQRGVMNPHAKLTETQVEEIRAARARGERLATIAKRHGVSFQHVSVVARRLSRSTG